jgi:uncharacterized protein YjbJ (UPF0337 family)
MNMNRERFAGQLEQFVGRVKECWGILTNDPALAAAGQYAQLAGRIRARCALSAERSERQLSEFLARHRDWENISSPPAPPAQMSRQAQAGLFQRMTVISSR